MKTTTLTIRLTQEDKKLISDLAWSRRISTAELLVDLAHRAAGDPLPPVQDLRSELNKMKSELEDLSREIAALAPQRRSVAKPAADGPEYIPGETPDCGPDRCRWFYNGDCIHPEYKDHWDTVEIHGDCPNWEPAK